MSAVGGAGSPPPGSGGASALALDSAAKRKRNDPRLARSGELGVAPLVSELIEQFVDSAPVGRPCWALSCSHRIEDDLWGQTRDEPTNHFKTRVFGSAVSARAGFRHALKTVFFPATRWSTAEPGDSPGEAHVDLRDFYIGAAGEADAAVAALELGVENAEAKFAFLWKEDWKPDGSITLELTSSQMIRRRSSEEGTALTASSHLTLFGGKFDPKARDEHSNLRQPGFRLVIERALIE